MWDSEKKQAYKKMKEMQEEAARREQEEERHKEIQRAIASDIAHRQHMEKMRVQNERMEILGAVAQNRVLGKLHKRMKEIGIEDYEIKMTSSHPKFHVIVFKDEDFNLYKLQIKPEDNVMIHHIDEDGNIRS